MAETATATRSTDVSGDSLLTLRDVTFAVAWNVRGDPQRSEFASAVQQALHVSLPLPLTGAAGDGATMLWLGPRSWLVVADVDVAQPAPDFDRTRGAINTARGALFDLSASYVAWSIEGTTGARALNRACPLDFRERSFPPGHCAQSTLGHVNALFYRPGAAAAFVVMVARSLARDAWHTLTTVSAHQIGPTVTFSASASTSSAPGPAGRHRHRD